MSSTSTISASDPNESARLLVDLSARLTARAQRDEDLRCLLELLGRWLLDVSTHARSDRGPFDQAASSGTPVPEIVPAQSSIDTLQSLEPTEHPAAIIEPADAQQIADLVARFGSPAVSPLISMANRVPEPHQTKLQSRRSISELSNVRRRMELKADACAWAVRRFDESVAGNGFHPCKHEYDQLRARADTMQPCFLWMIHPETQFIQREDWTRLELCYRACAEVLSLVITFTDEYERNDNLLMMLGEAQSSIRAAMASCGALTAWSDAEQQAVFAWCKDEGDFRHVFNPFLALNSLADPSLAEALLTRTRQLRVDLTARRDGERQIRRGLNTVRYHLGQLEDSDENTSHHWTRIAEGIQSMLSAGAPASLPDIVNLLLPVADEVPEALLNCPGISEVLRYVDQRLARDQSAPLAAPPVRETGEEVLRVRAALRGSRVVIIGGDERRHAKELLERDFELAELDWQTSKPHQSISFFEAAISRPETRLVILMIRWASHSYEGLQEICEAHAKPFVRLPGGYNPTQVAHQILLQVSEQLSIVAPTR